LFSEGDEDVGGDDFEMGAFEEWSVSLEFAEEGVKGVVGGEKDGDCGWVLQDSVVRQQQLVFQLLRRLKSVGDGIH
jgi:hypothetical protein